MLVLEKTLESPWDSTDIKVNPKGNQLWIFIRRTDELQYFGQLMWWAYSFEKTLVLGKIGDMRRSRGQRMKWWNCIADSMDMSLSTLQEIVKDREAWSATIHVVSVCWTWLSKWITNIGIPLVWWEEREAFHNFIMKSQSLIGVSSCSEILIFFQYSFSLSLFFCFVLSLDEIRRL